MQLSRGPLANITFHTEKQTRRCSKGQNPATSLALDGDHSIRPLKPGSGKDAGGRRLLELHVPAFIDALA
jgi:hypothetical protein